MLKSFIPTAVVSILLAGAAFAGSPSGDAQLAAAAGVPAGQYTAAELVKITEARRENNLSALDYYLSGANRESTAARTTGNAGLARAAGVPDGQFTSTELVFIIEAKRDGDTGRANFFATGQNRVPGNEASVVTPGEAMLAASLGVDPARYTLAEMVKMLDD